AIDFFNGKNPEAIMRTLRAVLRRAAPTSREATLLRAMAIETQKTIRGDVLFDSLMTAGREDPAEPEDVAERADAAGLRDRDRDGVADGTAGGVGEGD
ncbi:MAG TPA: hypothetical protein VHG09_09650, partial [Longimicrobiales bacterium]|nr:hypothetical protein [Longimicrobiales bacterium]